MASVSRISLLPETALTADNTGTAQVLELLSENFVGWIHVSACNAATTVAAKIEHSADGTNFVDLVSFTSIVGTTGFEAKQITSNVLPYIRSYVDLSGLTQAATVAISFYHDKKK